MKAIAIVMVISLHVPIYYTDFIENNSLKTMIQYAFRIISEGVPIFIFINGFLLINKKFDFKRHMKKTSKIFALLVLWSIIITFISKIIFREKIFLIDIIKNIFKTGIGNKYTGVLWFLQSLITLYLIYPIIKSVHDNDKKIYNYFFVIVLITTVGINLCTIISNVLMQLFKFNYLNVVIEFLNKFQIIKNGDFLLFFMLGGYIYEKQDEIKDKKNTVLYVIMGILSWIIAFEYAYFMSNYQHKTYIDNFNYHTIFILIFVIALFAITYRYKAQKNNLIDKFIRSVGQNSLGIYLVHILIIRIINELYTPNNFLERVIILIITLLSSLIIVLIGKRIPIVKNIISI